MTDNAQNTELIVLGADHRSSTMLLRDKIIVSEPQLPAFYERLSEAELSESLVVSVGDRKEIYGYAADCDFTVCEIIKLLSARSGLGRSEIEAQTYVLTGQDAIRHFLAVYCGLDGLVVGDPRMPGRIDQSRQTAQTAGAAGSAMTALVNGAKHVSERILRETEIGRRPVTISAAAVQVARDIHGNLGDCSALLIGSGEMGEMLASSLLAGGLKHLVAAHPLSSRADAVAQQLNCHVGDFDKLPALLKRADIVLTAVNSRRFVLAAEQVQAATTARRRKPIFLIDTGVPGDVETNVENVEDAYLYTLDDLERVTREGLSGREAEAEKAWAILDNELPRIVANLPAVAPTEAATRALQSTSPEELRRLALEEAGGDADKATRLLLEKLSADKDGDD
ncbi:MAG: glutamyl-tRNA reductase [Rhodospirillaceae bacterium]